jgi:DinB family protein
MKRVLVVAFGLLCAAGLAQAQVPAAQPITLATSLQRGYAGVKQNLTEEIAKMPEADFSFKPGPAPELRNFGMLFGHVANAQFGSCSAALGQPNPNQGHNLETEATTKAALTKALADSFAVCDKAFASLTDQNAMEMVKQGQNEIARSALLAGVVIHSNEMYGTASVYMRAKGLVPPSTERQTLMMQGRGARGNPGR